MIDLLWLLLGAVLGVLLTTLFDCFRRVVRRRDPLYVDVKRSCAPPMWFATNEPPPTDTDKAASFEERIVESSPFCCFAKLNLEITNKSLDIVYITNIRVSKQPINSHYKYRVRTVPQGVSSAVRLFICLDDEEAHFSTSLINRFSITGDFFEYGHRIKIAPGESEYVFLTLVALLQSWEFNCSIEYEINNKERVSSPILKDNNCLIKYEPGNLERDYCAFYERERFEYDQFEDAMHFACCEDGQDPSDHQLDCERAISYLETQIID